ncbi:MAG: 2-amino-4-hydroxy-6-hydroxymethyldihydropteridine diphosphokinase [Muribaculaceae bacterium]
MNTAILSIGSNTADSSTQMHLCVEWIKEHFNLTLLSGIYSSPAINGKDNDYLNAVAAISTAHTHEQLVAIMKQYEQSCGRTPQSKALGNIPIDIDVVLWNGEVIRPKDFAQNYFKIGWQQITNS